MTAVVTTASNPNMATLPPEARFLDKVVLGDGCWEWIGAKCSDGYAALRVDGQQIGAHRFSYRWLRGEVPPGELDHLCRNRGCVRPSHLEAVSHRENVLRGEGPAAVAFRTNACYRGHPFTPENTRGMARGNRMGRTCRACLNAATRERRRIRWRTDPVWRAKETARGEKYRKAWYARQKAKKKVPA